MEKAQQIESLKKQLIAKISETIKEEYEHKFQQLALEAQKHIQQQIEQANNSGRALLRDMGIQSHSATSLTAISRDSQDDITTNIDTTTSISKVDQ